GAIGVRAHALERRLVLVEELLAGGEELLADILVLVAREHGDGPDEAERAPHDGHRGAHDLAVALLGNEASPRLHEPAGMDVLGAAEDLARTGPDLALEEVAERLLDDVAHLGQIALANAPDLDEGRPPLGIQPRPVHRRPHACSGSPASSSMRVMTPEWSR